MSLLCECFELSPCFKSQISHGTSYLTCLFPNSITWLSFVHHDLLIFSISFARFRKMIKTSTKSNPWNGKIRETPASLIDSEFTDLEPTITYRHVLSNNLGVKDPLRVIALCDSDAFYAACEMVRLNVDKDVPLVVLQWDSLIAVNYPARQYGITRMIKVKDALNKCPHLKVVHVATYKEGDSHPGYWENVDTKTHKVSLDYYRRESIKIATKFRESLPSSVEIGKNWSLAAYCSLTILARKGIH